ECVEGHSEGSVWFLVRELLQWSPAQEQPLLAGVGEPDGRLGLVTLTFDVDDDTFAPFCVSHVIADAETERLGAVRHRAARLQRPLDDLVAVAVDRRTPAATTEHGAALPRAGLARALGMIHQLGRDLVEEPARRVVRG